jgi:homoserine O-acetyltransferase
MPAIASGPQTITLEGAVRLAGGRSLTGVQVAYETFGMLANDGGNAVLVCHALSGDAHVAAASETDGAARPGWWEGIVGPGLAIDTNRYFVLCANVLGGCSGTTGPGSIDPATGEPYGLRFPLVTIEDMVEVQSRLLDALGVERLLAVVGGSMGGMQALAWSALHPDRVGGVVAAATTGRLGAQAIAFNEVGRAAILADPAFANGDYACDVPPAEGLAIARMVGHITYLSQESMREKFGRRLRDRDEHAFDFVSEFEVESYLAYQGQRFVERFDANTYLYMTKAMDYFDWRPTEAPVLPRYLVTSFTSDWLFPTAQAREIVRTLLAHGAEVTFAEIDSPYGHDAFLLETERQGDLIAGFLDRIRSEHAERRAS